MSTTQAAALSDTLQKATRSPTALKISPAQRRTLHAVVHHQPAPGPRAHVLLSVEALQRKGLLTVEGRATASGLSLFQPAAVAQVSIGGAA